MKVVRDIKQSFSSCVFSNDCLRRVCKAVYIVFADLTILDGATIH